MCCLIRFDKLHGTWIPDERPIVGGAVLCDVGRSYMAEALQALQRFHYLNSIYICFHLWNKDSY